jgi:ferredoxin
MQGNQCVRCGLCMTGCPYSLIYSAAHTFDRLRASGAVTYHGGLMATGIEETADGVTVTAKELRTGAHHQFTGDRVLVACGAIGSTRLVLGSLQMFDRPVEVAESTQFLLPFFSARPTADPRDADNFTLNQFNMVVRLGDDRELSQLHFYTYNDAFPENLPGVLRSDRAEPIRRAALRRLTVALGYLPSWAAPTFRVTARKPGHDGELPDLEVAADEAHFARNPFLRKVLGRVTTSARALDLWPALPGLQMSAPGKSYHWGSTFAHSEQPDRNPASSDVLGRVGPWRRVHLVDASVFPTVPATTFTLTIMANAHRIADTVAEELTCRGPR